jgi:mono/diheme cytochrome c family protein
MSPPSFDMMDAEHIDKGKVRFGTNCAAYCHGFEGSGGRTPAFKGRQDLDPQEVFKIISFGRKGADIMPAWGSGFSADKRWELVAYIMHLSRQPAPLQDK